MTNRVRTQDAQASLRQIIQENAKDAAGNNNVVSKAEAKKLDPFVKREEEKIRAEGGAGTRVKVDALVDRATSDAMEVWDRFNPPGQGLDSALLSQEEVKKIKRADPQLGALTELAMLRAGKRGQDAESVVKDFFNRFDFSNGRLHANSFPGGKRVDARVGQEDRHGLTARVLKSFDYYYRAEAADWASVSLHRGKLGNHDVCAIYMTTDGDDGYLEVLTDDGTPLASARLYAEKMLAWDEFFGRARLAPPLITMEGVKNTDGFSEDAERIAAGQIPSTWAPDVSIAKGTLRHDNNGNLTTVDLSGTSLNQVQQEMAYAALGLIWDASLRHRAQADKPTTIGQGGAGDLRLGLFTNPNDGERYLVADWKDVDDDSFTFYFKMSDHGLKLAIQQYNN